ncbi:hypothetical protein BH10PAT3_BH10PAT3_4700 [soil metagenome]
MSKKKLQTHQKIAKTLVSVLVLAFFIVPSFLTVRWAVSVFLVKDPRKVATIQQLQVRAMDKTEGARPFEVPLISVTFDDGWESVYTAALPILQRLGIPTTQYIITTTLSSYSYVSAGQIQSMQEAGHEIAAHTITHPDLTTLAQSELIKELSEPQVELEKKFGKIDDFTSPYGAYNAHTLSAISTYYRSQKNAEGDPEADPLLSLNLKDNFNPLNMKSYSVRSNTTIKELQILIKAAQQNNGWLILTYHQIDDTGETFSVTPENFEEQMLLLNTTPTRITTVGRVLDAVLPDYKRGQ